MIFREKSLAEKKKNDTEIIIILSLSLFSGHLKESNRKDCVLIIDPETGEITLERISAQIRVKKTRPERPDRSELNPKSMPSSLLLGGDPPPSSGGGASTYHTPPKSSSNGITSRPLTPLEPLMRRGSPGKIHERFKLHKCYS